MDAAIEGADAVRRVKRGRPARVSAIEQPSPAKAYAMRVWAGQSVDVPPAERLARVHAALVGQNLPTDGITLETME